MGALWRPAPTRLAMAHSGGGVRIWNYSSGEVLATLTAHRGSQTHRACFSPCGQHVLTHSEDWKVVKAWKWQAGTCLHTWDQHFANVASFSPNGEFVLVGCSDGSSHLWHLESGKLRGTLTGHLDAVTCLGFSRDGAYALSASDGGSVKHWLLNRCQCVDTMHFGSEVTCACLSPSGGSAVVAFSGGEAKVWMFREARQSGSSRANPCRLKRHLDRITTAAFSPDGQQVLTSSFDCSGRLSCSWTGQCQHMFLGHTGPVVAARFSPTGDSVVTASHDRTARLWSSKSGECLQIFTGHSDAITAVLCSPEGENVMTGSEDGVTKVWCLHSGCCLRDLCGSGPVISLDVANF